MSTQTTDKEKTETKPQGHYACPHCQHTKFKSHQNYTDHGSQEITGMFQAQTKGRPEFNVTDYGSCDAYDTDGGDYGDEKTCLQCKRVFTEPMFIPERVEALECEAGKIAALRTPHALKYNRREADHATVVTAIARSVRLGFGRERRRLTHCCVCDRQVLDARNRTIQLYRDCPARPSGRENLIDSRQLPVLLTMKVCRKCIY